MNAVSSGGATPLVALSGAVGHVDRSTEFANADAASDIKFCAIDDPGCVAKTFPGFFDVLDELRAGSGASR